jgi:hypothetical protein
MTKHAMEKKILKTFRTRKNISEDGGLASGLAIEINQKIEING